MHFSMKSTLKNNRNYTPKQTINQHCQVQHLQFVSVVAYAFKASHGKHMFGNR